MAAMRPKAGILDLPLYQSGLAPPDGQAGFKLSANENPLGASPKAIEAYKAQAERLHIYPDEGAAPLRLALAEKYQLNEEQIICGLGSDEFLHILPRAYAEVGDEIIHTEYGFIIYQFAARAAGAKAVAVAEPHFRADVDLILSAVTARTKIVFLANPNNPTGTMLSADEVRRLHAGLREDILFVLDGAYTEYVAQDKVTTGFDMVAAFPNVVTTRTFSKIYGLAALRLGWAYAPPEIAAVMNRLRLPFSVSAPASAAAIAALQDDEHIATSVAHNCQWREWLAQEIKACGFQSIPSEGNFILVHFPPASGLTAERAYALLYENGVVVRPLKAYGLADYMRITIGTEEAMRRVADMFKRLAALKETGE